MAGRLPDWEPRLSAWIAANRSREFVWGEWDCILMACSAVEAQTGDDPAAEYRGRYSDARGAAKALRDLGKGTLLRTVDAVFERRPVGRARRGDLVMRKGAIGGIVGTGLVPVARAEFEKAWTV